MRLRYTGTRPVSFTSIGVEVEPGDEFDVPDDIAEAFSRRTDLEIVAAPEPAPAKAVRRAAKADPEPEPAPVEAAPTEALATPEEG